SPLAMHLGDSPRSRRNGDCPPYDARRTVAITMAPVQLPSEDCLESLPAGTTLGPYEIVAPLGAGGMGVVYRARDLKLGRTVAVKVLSGDFSSDSQRTRRFEQEAGAPAALNHSNVGVVYALGETPDGQPFIAMEYVEGHTLRRVLQTGP